MYRRFYCEFSFFLRRCPWILYHAGEAGRINEHTLRLLQFRSYLFQQIRDRYFLFTANGTGPALSASKYLVSFFCISRLCRFPVTIHDTVVVYFENPWYIDPLGTWHASPTRYTIYLFHLLMTVPSLDVKCVRKSCLLPELIFRLNILYQD